MSPRHRFSRCERGTAAIEFAFIGLLLILGTVAIIEVGRALFMANELAHAADRASRIVMLQFDISKTDLTTAVQDEQLLTGLVPENVGVEIDPDTGAAFRMVQLSYPFTPMVAGLTIGSVTLTADRRVAK